MECNFCGIVNGNYSCRRVFEDEYTMAFMDTAGDVDGHILVIPKKHCVSILDCDEQTLSHLAATVRKVSSDLVEKCGYSGVNLLNASGEGSGQSVNHFHIHIIPRKPDDGVDTWFRFKGAENDIDDVYNNIVSCINSESKIKFEKYNPSDEKHSCVVRTMTKLTGKDYGAVKHELILLAEQMGYPTYNEPHVFEMYMESHLIYKHRDYRDTKVSELNPGNGTYCVLATNNSGFFHLFPLIDNVIYDRRNDSLELYAVSLYKKSDE